VLPSRIRLLAGLIARKPSRYSSEWARTIDESFIKYTRTSLINSLLGTMSALLQRGWPMPAFIDLANEHDKFTRSLMQVLGNLSIVDPRALRVLDVGIGTIAIAALWIDVTGDTTASRQLCDTAMVELFDHHSSAIFDWWSNCEVFAGKQRIISDIQSAKASGLWAATITAAVPLLDHVVRQFFGTDRLNVSMQVIRDAFARAGLKPLDMAPGSAVWDGLRDPSKGNAFATSLEDDLRLPGIYLSSFVEFASRYYEWYSTATGATAESLNRHAIRHCASEYWTESNAVKVLVFVDLTLRLQRVLKILLTGEDPGPTGV